MNAGMQDHGQDITIDTSLIPAHVKEEIARTVLEGVYEYFQQPGVQERFEEWQKARNERRKQNETR